MIKSNWIVLIFFFAFSIALVESACPPTIPTGSTWVASTNCTSGNTYNTPPGSPGVRRHCHCYNKCGYICDPITGGGPGPGPATTRPSNCRQPPLGTSQTWVASTNCTSGNTYNTPSGSPGVRRHCHCYNKCGYICDPITGGPGMNPGTNPPRNCRQPPLATGSTWVPSTGCIQGNTYNTPQGNPGVRRHCHCFNRCGYICDPITSSGGPSTVPPRACRQPSLPTGSTWVANSGCSRGSTYNTEAGSSGGSRHCHCWGRCGYICDPIASGTLPPPTSGVCRQPALAPGQTWVSSPGCSGAYNTGNKHCHCFNHCGFKCDPIGSGPSVAPPTSRVCRQPPLSPGQTWVSSPGCSGAYNTATKHCHCFSHCGFKCDTLPNNPPPTTLSPGSTPGPTCRPPPASRIPAGSQWVSSPGCPEGTTFIRTSPSPRAHCYCQFRCGYICTPLNGTGGSTPVSTESTTVTSESTTVAGGGTTVAGGSTTVAGGSTTLAGGSTTVAGGSTTLAGGSTTVAGTGTTAAGTTAAGTTAAGTTAAGTTAAGTTAAGTTAAGTTAAGTTAAGTTAAGTTAAGTTAAGTTAAGTTAAGTTAAGTTAAGTTAAGTTAAGTTAAGTTAAGTTAAGTTAAGTTVSTGTTVAG